MHQFVVRFATSHMSEYHRKSRARHVQLRRKNLLLMAVVASTELKCFFFWYGKESRNYGTELEVNHVNCDSNRTMYVFVTLVAKH